MKIHFENWKCPIFDGSASSCLTRCQQILSVCSFGCKNELNSTCHPMNFHNRHHTNVGDLASSLSIFGLGNDPSKIIIKLNSGYGYEVVLTKGYGYLEAVTVTSKSGQGGFWIKDGASLEVKDCRMVSEQKWTEGSLIKCVSGIFVPDFSLFTYFLISHYIVLHRIEKVFSINMEIFRGDCIIFSCLPYFFQKMPEILHYLLRRIKSLVTAEEILT